MKIILLLCSMLITQISFAQSSQNRVKPVVIKSTVTEKELILKLELEFLNNHDLYPILGAYIVDGKGVLPDSSNNDDMSDVLYFNDLYIRRSSEIIELKIPKEKVCGTKGYSRLAVVDRGASFVFPSFVEIACDGTYTIWNDHFNVIKPTSL